MADNAIFHEKTGIIEDRTGIAWTGNLDETAAGWERNRESITVFRSWMEPQRVDAEEASFAGLWSKPVEHLLVMEVPKAIRDNLMRFVPDGLARHLKDAGVPPEEPETPPSVPEPRPPPSDRTSLVGTFMEPSPEHGAGRFPGTQARRRPPQRRAPKETDPRTSGVDLVHRNRLERRYVDPTLLDYRGDPLRRASDPAPGFVRVLRIAVLGRARFWRRAALALPDPSSGKMSPIL